MKTAINNEAAENFESVKRFLYFSQVSIIGLFIPFLFVIGINTNYGTTPGNEISISKPHKVNVAKATVSITAISPDKHS